MMQDAGVLDLALLPQYAAPARARGGLRLPHWLLAALGFLFALAALGLGARALGWGSEGAALASVELGAVAHVEDISVDDKAQIVEQGEVAQLRNAEIPFLALPLEHARAFGIKAAGRETYDTALKCLSQAVYYEAAVEPLQGRRAVAQVVLNRVKHPAYPKSVCGVVYQGAERVTGCQFSFTCDGALLRAPGGTPWREAQAVAKAALAGYVEPTVGTATFYHADYVLPKWAFELGKISQIGRHIFYRFHGNWGRATYFSGRYAGIERIPALDLMALRDRALADGTLLAMPEAEFVPGLTVTPHVTDRHAEADVGGRIDMTKEWRPSIPDPLAAKSRLSEVVAATSSDQPAKVAVSEAAGASVGP
jgi:hypothetical protein